MRDASLREVLGFAFRHFTQADTAVCLALFELNCPD